MRLERLESDLWEDFFNVRQSLNANIRAQVDPMQKLRSSDPDREPRNTTAKRPGRSPRYLPPRH